ncbi:hypothetical protein BHM03_00052952, partial [Ensete ventricosum]
VESSLTEVQCASPKRAWATITQYKEMPNFKLGLKKMGRVSYEYGYRVTLAHFQARYPKLVIEDPYDDNVPMEVEVSFYDNDPPSA